MKLSTLILSMSILAFLSGSATAAPVRIVGKSWSEGDALPGHQDMLTLLKLIEAIKVNDGQYTSAIIQEIAKGSAGEQKLLEHVSSNITAALQQYAATQKADEILKNLTGPNAQPSNLCTQPEIAAGMQNAREAERGVSAALGQGYRKREQETKDSTHASEYIAEELTPEDILTKTTLTEKDMAYAVEFGRRTTNPFPLPQKTSAGLDSMEKTRAEAIRNLDMERRTPSRALVQYDIAFRAPTAEIGTLLKKMAESSGFQGTPPGLVKVGGKESASWAAYYEFLRMSRTGNPNWYIELATMEPAALQREQIIIEAQQLELAIRQHELLRLIGVTQATHLSMEADKARTAEGYHQ